MNYRVLRELLDEVTSTEGGDTFRFLAQMAAFASLAEDEDKLQQARELLIHVLEKRIFFQQYEPVIQTLLRNLGLFPYLNHDTNDVAVQLATEVHRPTAMPSDIVFTTKQAEVYRELMTGRSVVLSAPTSFGKSLLIDAVIASGMHRNIVVVVPTLALVDETRRRLLKFRSQYKVITHLSQEPDERNIFVHTQERVIENQHIKNIDFFVIDEFYKLNIEGTQDSDARSVILNQAFYKLAKQAKQFYMLGPNIHELPDGFGKNYRCSFIRTDFSTVASEAHLVPAGPDDSTRLRQLIPQLDGPTLIFSGSVNSVRKFGAVVADSRSGFIPDTTLRLAIEWLGQNYHPKWGLVSSLQRGVGVHHGKLPRSVAQLLVRLFNERHIDYLVCTSTLIEGVNTAARNVVIADNTIARKKYDFFTFNNIRGRSGRMWEHYVGHVYLFHSPPERELAFVDVPVFTQGQEIPEALLVQLDKSDLSDISSEKLKHVWRQEDLSLETIKANSGFDPSQQIALARELQADLAKFHRLLSWEGLPTYEQMLTIIDLSWRNFEFRGSTDVRSASQLAFKVGTYRRDPSYTSQIRKAIQGKTGVEADEALESFLEFVRQWLSFRVPRMFNAVDKIQREVFTRNGIKSGNYAYFCSQLESLFMNPVVTALEEYGVPIQLAQKILPRLGDSKTLDDALDLLMKVRANSFQGLSGFEMDLLRPLCAD
jgi:hypothetical protein